MPLLPPFFVSTTIQNEYTLLYFFLFKKIILIVKKNDNQIIKFEYEDTIQWLNFLFNKPQR